MPTFSSQPLNQNPLHKTVTSTVRRRPFVYFGLPFLTIVVLSSFGLQEFTKTRYELHEQRVQSVSKEEELGMSKGRKKVDLKEEYYRLQGLAGAAPALSDDWENVRVPRPKGVPEWGPPQITTEDAPVVGRRENDRLV